MVLQAEGKEKLRASPVPHLGFKDVLEGVQVTEGLGPFLALLSRLPPKMAGKFWHGGKQRSHRAPKAVMGL